ncbi:MAG: ribosome small subunit-dependent GTPase A [Verrucomicrobia bacterium]|nr:ribosome small subunit-dependent GTPase A [Verrucomicrobiota bacterium]
MNLDELGWDSGWAEVCSQLDEPGARPARVAREDRGAYLLLSEHGELRARLSGRFHHEVQSNDGGVYLGASEFAELRPLMSKRHHHDVRARHKLPAVGDWVAVRAQPEQGEAIICALLPRRSFLARKAASKDDEAENTAQQVLVANVDTAFIVTGLDGNFNVRRVERYVTLVAASGVTPVVVLNKADLCDDVDARVLEVDAVACGVAVHAMSAVENDGLDALNGYLGAGKTVVFLGSSGVGKSTIINRLLGEERQKVTAISGPIGKGLHTTTSRELILLPAGGVLIDTPGMRELHVWADEGALSTTFEDVEALAAQCRFRDCRHQSEPGCAIKAAIEDGSLSSERFRNYLRLQRELTSLARRQSGKARLAEKKFGKWKKLVARRHGRF